MYGLIQFLIHQFYTNQFMTAAVATVIMTTFGYMARNIPLRIWAFIQRQTTTVIRFNSDLPDYLPAQEFVVKHVVSTRWSRTFLYSTSDDWDDETSKRVTTFYGLTIGYGDHIGWWKGRLVLIERELQQNSQTAKFKEHLKLTFVTRNQELVMDFAQRVKEYGDRTTDRNAVVLWINGESYWKLANRMSPRPMSTVFTSNNEAQQLVDHLTEFSGKRDWYVERGIPYHTGVLLTGEPGTGKTSLIHAVATETGRSLYYLNLGSVEDDKELIDLVSSGRNWARSILVIEDADATGVDTGREQKAKTKTKQLTLSAMLNMLDGLLTPDGLVVLATSNHPERLDPALLRSGRFDLRLDIGKLDWPAFVNMAQVFGFDLSADDPRGHDFIPDTGANLRTKLLEGGVDAIFC
jgi:chaperone BCS1